ncbi:hypothetical protein Cgig2_026357 [Carnegiea gigantea]|uniref:Uncharacterized protein n=1 Tax=Carnegiea gigantea TaxID=171969 RepID=A0A9Q1QHC6_9CARY|nr:hypothetical protein Cgig2_026357 [Carnegiea gigantea]
MNSISDSQTCIIERRPARMLKEFLRDDEHSSSKSCSSSDPPPPATLPRSRNKSRAAISSFQKLLASAVKSFHRISPSSPPATLQRSLSKRLLTKFRRSKKSGGAGEGKVIKVKDILRWRSFRDEDRKSPPSDSPATYASTSITTTSSGSSKSEESDFSFTADELPRWWCEEGKKRSDEVDVDVVEGGDLVREITGAMHVPETGQQEGSLEFEEDKEQHSPVSVLNSPFRDEVLGEEAVSSFDQSLANVESKLIARLVPFGFLVTVLALLLTDVLHIKSIQCTIAGTKQRLLESIQWLETLAGVDEQASRHDDSETEDQEEEEKDAEVETAEENAIEAKTRDYMFKVLGRLTREGQGVKSRDCIKDMETEAQGSKFGEEREEVGEELEACLLQDLVDEILVDFFG